VVLARFGVAAAVYAGSAALLASQETMSVMRLPWWLVLASTALVAGLLLVLRAPIDAVADRVVYGGKAPGYSEARELVGRLATSVPIDEVLPQLAATIGEVARTPRAEVRFWLDRHQQWRQTWPEAAAPQGDPLTLGVRHLGTEVGEIEVDQVGGPIDDINRRRLGGIAGPVGSALATVRLTYALRLRRADLERLTTAIDASTRRLLGARRAERQRFRDEIAGRVLPEIDAAAAAPSASDAAEHAQRALDEIRAISRGIFPPRLAEAGLSACLRDWADMTPHATLEHVDGGWDPALRTCLYFAVVTTTTAMLNGGASDVRIAVRRDGTRVELAILARRAPSGDWSTAVRDRLEAFDAVLAAQVTDTGVILSASLPASDNPLMPAAPTGNDPSVGTES
jgi:signal transduction histidine kinase